MTEIKHRQQNPAPQIDYSEIHIPNDKELGTGTYTTLLKPNAFSEQSTIVSIIINAPIFQMSVNLNFDTGEIPVLLGKADGSDPISKKLFVFPDNLNIAIRHSVVAKFVEWQITSLLIDGRSVPGKKP